MRLTQNVYRMEIMWLVDLEYLTFSGSESGEGR